MTSSRPAPVPGPEAPRTGILRTLAGPVLVLVLLGVGGRLAGGYWPAVTDRIAGLGAWGYVLFCGAWIVLGSLCFPASVLGVSAGALFGLPLGLALVFVSLNLAGLVMFALGRGLLRGRIRALAADRPRLAALDRLAGRRALRLNVLTRLSPLNYGLACYTLAAGRTGLAAYLVGNLATVPSMVLQVWLGTLAAETGRAAGGDAMPTSHLVLLGLGLVFLFVLTWQIGRLVRQALAEGGAPGADDRAGGD